MAENDERTVHRLEAFSDIVMGFCLAESGLNFVVPKDNAALVAMWPSLNAFALSFILISTLWWYHHKLFVTYVVLNPATIVANFIMLAALALGVYFEQVAAHFIAGGVDPFPAERLWVGCMAIVYGLLAVMYAIGIWNRWRGLDGEELRWGVNRTVRSVMAALALALLCAALPSVGRVVNATIVCIVAGILLRGVVAPRLTSYLLARRLAGSTATAIESA